jgi:DNA-binding transcriptional LysR family regulator
MTGRDLLESDALRSFAVFAEHRNFTTAAAALHISQPSLHVKIRKLAAALGTDLYEREGRRLTLTAAGEQLAAFALDSRRRLDEFLRELHQESTSTLTIAAGRGRCVG